MSRRAIAPGLALLLALAGAAWSQHPTIAWHYNTTPPLMQAGFQLLRCEIATGQHVCTPTAELAGARTAATTLTYTDTTAASATGYCWTVVALDAAGQRSPPAVTPAHEPQVCNVGTVLPPPMATTAVLAGADVQVSWQAPTFGPHTVPPSALTAYRILGRGATAAHWWSTEAHVGAAVTTYTDTTPYRGEGNCYRVTALYGAQGEQEGGDGCVQVPIVAPQPPQAPTNLHVIAPQRSGP